MCVWRLRARVKRLPVVRPMEDALRRVSKNLANCQRTLRRRSRAASAWWGLTARMARVAVAVYVLSRFNLELAKEFARRARKKRRRFEDTQLAEPPIQDWFVSLPLAEVLAVQEPVTFQEHQIAREAREFIAGFATASWVKAMNYEHHVAPPTSALFEKYACVLQEHGGQLSSALSTSADGRDSARPGRAGRYMQLWCQRLRKTWGLRLGKLAGSAFLPVEEARAKAEACDFFSASVARRILVHPQ